MKYLLCGAALCLFWGFSVTAETIDVEYKRFYSHVNKLKSEDTNALQFAFGFIHVQTKVLCTVKNAKIVTQKKDIPLNVTPEYRFTVPAERALKLADAVVQIDLQQAANLCDMSVQLETKPEYLKQQYSKAELLALHEQYTAFFNEMGSFLSFMMPRVKGLMLHFADKRLSYRIDDTLTIQQGMMIIEDEKLSSLEALALPQPPLRITALATR